MKKIISLLVAISLFFTMSITAITASAAAPEGYVAISVDANTLGVGYLYEPLLVPFYKDDSIVEITARFVGSGNYNVKTTSWGEYINGFKLQSDITANLPAEIQAEVDKWYDGEPLDSGASKAGQFLMENDYFNFYEMGGSGWMVMLNDAFPDVSASDVRPKNGDVICWQFSLFWGADLGVSDLEYGWGPAVVIPAEKADLTYAVASVNSAANKSDLLSDSSVFAAYKSAYSALTSLTATQAAVNNALAALDTAVEALTPVNDRNFLQRIVDFFREIFQNIQNFFANLFN